MKRKPDWRACLERNGRPFPLHALTHIVRGVALIAAGACLLVLSDRVLADTMPDANDEIPTAQFSPPPDDDVDHAALLDAARAIANERYLSGDVGPLAFFSPESWRQWREGHLDSQQAIRTEGLPDIRLGDLGMAPIIRVEAAPEGARAARDGDQIRRIARLLGGYQSRSIRPAALEGALEYAAWALIAGHGQDVSDIEAQRQQIAFLSSGRLAALTQRIGHRIHAGWSPPEGRLIHDGALIAVTLDEQLDITDMSIERSTGRRFYDEAAMLALRQAAPFDEARELQPWLQETVQTLLFSFGRPPLSPEEFRRRQQAGELGQLRDALEAERLDYDPIETDYYDQMLHDIEREITVLNGIRWAEDVSRDATLLVTLSIPLGVVMDVNVRRSSGDIQFDRLAVQAIDNASPFRGIRALTPTQQATFEQFHVHVHPHGVR